MSRPYGPMRFEYDLEDLLPVEERPQVTFDPRLGAAVAMPDHGPAGIDPGTLVPPEFAVGFGLALVEAGRALQAAERSEIFGRPAATDQGGEDR